MAHILFDAGARFDPEDPDTGEKVAEFLFPNWDWEKLWEDPAQNIIVFQPIHHKEEIFSMMMRKMSILWNFF